MVNESEIFFDVIKKIKEIGTHSGAHNGVEAWEIGDEYTVISNPIKNNGFVLKIGNDSYALEKQALFKTESSDDFYISKNGMDNLYHDSGLDDMMDAIVHLDQIEDVFLF